MFPLLKVFVALAIFASGSLWAASKTNSKTSTAARRHKKAKITSTSRPKASPSKSPKPESTVNDLAALPDPNIEGSALLGIYSVRSGSAIVPFMAKPTSKQQSDFALPPGTSGIKIFSRFHNNEGVAWHVAQVGEKLAWVDIFLLKTEPLPAPPPAPRKQSFLQRVADFITLERLAQLAEVFAGLGIIRFAIWLVQMLRRRAREKALASELDPFFNNGEVRAATRYYVPTYVCDFSSTDAYEPRDIIPFAHREKAIPYLLRQLVGKAPEEQNKYYLVLAESGMGKTTLLINLVIAHAKHAARSSIRMRVLPLGEPGANRTIDEYTSSDRTRTILLLDAFDEDPDATPNYQARLAELINKAWGFRQIIITCRTQFFPSADERPDFTGKRSYGVNAAFTKFKKLYISPFDDEDVRLYLKRRFPAPHWKKRSKARAVVDRAQNLMARPMLLAHVESLVRRKQDYEYSVEIYEEMVSHWLGLESVKVGNPEYGECLRSFSMRLAVDIWEHRVERRGLYATMADIDDVAASTKVDVTLLTKDNISSRSLLNRTAEGNLKFSHNTILEYFLAAVAFNDTKFLTRLDEAKYANAYRVKTFLAEQIHLPLPNGRLLTQPISELLAQIYAGKDPFPGVPFLIARDSEFRMICWTTTPPSMVRMISLVGYRITVHVCYRAEFAVSSSLASQWAAETARDERIAHVQLCGTHLVSARPMIDSFVEQFQKLGIDRRLEVEHVEAYVR